MHQEHVNAHFNVHTHTETDNNTVSQEQMIVFRGWGTFKDPRSWAWIIKQLNMFSNLLLLLLLLTGVGYIMQGNSQRGGRLQSAFWIFFMCCRSSVWKYRRVSPTSPLRPFSAEGAVGKAIFHFSLRSRIESFSSFFPLILKTNLQPKAAAWTWLQSSSG